MFEVGEGLVKPGGLWNNLSRSVGSRFWFKRYGVKIWKLHPRMRLNL